MTSSDTVPPKPVLGVKPGASTRVCRAVLLMWAAQSLPEGSVTVGLQDAEGCLATTVTTASQLDEPAALDLVSVNAYELPWLDASRSYAPPASGSGMTSVVMFEAAAVPAATAVEASIREISCALVSRRAQPRLAKVGGLVVASVEIANSSGSKYSWLGVLHWATTCLYAHAFTAALHAFLSGKAGICSRHAMQQLEATIPSRACGSRLRSKHARHAGHARRAPVNRTQSKHSRARHAFRT